MVSSCHLWTSSTCPIIFLEKKGLRSNCFHIYCYQWLWWLLTMEECMFLSFPVSSRNFQLPSGCQGSGFPMSKTRRNKKNSKPTRVFSTLAQEHKRTRKQLRKLMVKPAWSNSLNEAMKSKKNLGISLPSNHCVVRPIIDHTHQGINMIPFIFASSNYMNAVN